MDSFDRTDVVMRVFAWLGLTLVTLALLVAAFYVVFSAGFAGDSVPTSAFVLLGLAAAMFVASLVPLFLHTPAGLKVFGSLYLIVGGGYILSLSDVL